MTTTLVYRLMSDDGTLLGWVSGAVHARGDGSLYAVGDVVIPVDVPGLPSSVIVHWPDVNIHTTVSMPLGTPALSAGYTVTVHADGAKVLTLGEASGGLPPVTVRNPVRVDVPAGGMSILTH